MTHEDLPSSSFHYKQQSPFPAILQMVTSIQKRTRILNVFHLHPKTCASLNHPHVLPSFQSRNLQENWDTLHKDPTTKIAKNDTLQGTNISPKNGILKMIFLFPRWDMLIPWRVFPHLIPSISQFPNIFHHQLPASPRSRCRDLPLESWWCRTPAIDVHFGIIRNQCWHFIYWLIDDYNDLYKWEYMAIHCMISENDYLETWYYVQRCEFGSKILCI